MHYDYHVIVIGAGSAGLVVASGCANFDLKVALIEKDKMGGDCLNYGCVPSKAFLKSAHLADDIRNSEEFGVDSEIKINFERVVGRVKSTIEKLASHDSKERFEAMGVDVFSATAQLIDEHTVKSGKKTITGEYIVIASGSEPNVPPIPGLRDCGYYTNKNIFEIKELPEHLIVLGSGAIGLEIGQAFRFLGSRVTAIDMLPNIFSKDDPEVGPFMKNILEKDGIEFALDTKISEIKRNGKQITVVTEKKSGEKKQINGDVVLASLGRIPSDSIDLEKAVIKTSKNGYIQTDETLRTNIKNIFACGDITGPYQFTHMAGYQAGIVVKNIISPIKTHTDYSTVPWTTFTKPEVAHVGYTEQQAKSENVYEDHVTVDISETDRAITEGETKGFLKIIMNKHERLIGATMVGNKAGEIIATAVIAIKCGLSVTKFADMIFSYPTESEIFKFASYKLLKGKLKPWMKKVVKKIV